MIGCIIFAIAFGCYLKWVQLIWRLVAESNQASPESQCSRFMWLPAWKFHRKAFPTSGLRREIILLYFITFALMVGGLAVITYPRFEPLQMAH